MSNAVQSNSNLNDSCTLGDSLLELSNDSLFAKKKWNCDKDAISLFSNESRSSIFSLRDLGFRRRCSLPKIELPRISSFSQLIPHSNDAIKKFGNTLQKSSTLRLLNKLISSDKPNKEENGRSFSSVNLKNSPDPFKPWHKVSSPAYQNYLSSRRSNLNFKRRETRLWVESVDDSIILSLTPQEIKRQEVIHEFFWGEVDMLEDLNHVAKVYPNSMKAFSILTESDIQCIFSSLTDIIPCHQKIVSKFEDIKKNTPCIYNAGQVIHNWIPFLITYIDYCSNQISAKALLDSKSHDPKVNDFLNRCLESEFSRKLTLWTFLDMPRNRLLKYPLLFKRILKYTPTENYQEVDHLKSCISFVEKIIHRVDEQTGKSKCTYVLNHLKFTDPKQKIDLFSNCTELICSGLLKNWRGTKLHAFLFNCLFMLTRPIDKQGQLYYEVYRQPVGLKSLLIDTDINNNENLTPIRQALSSGPREKKFGFRLVKMCFDKKKQIYYTLFARDHHDLKKWIDSLNKAIEDSSLVDKKEDSTLSEQMSFSNATFYETIEEEGEFLTEGEVGKMETTPKNTSKNILLQSPGEIRKYPPTINEISEDVVDPEDKQGPSMPSSSYDTLKCKNDDNVLATFADSESRVYKRSFEMCSHNSSSISNSPLSKDGESGICDQNLLPNKITEKVITPLKNSFKVKSLPKKLRRHSKKLLSETSLDYNKQNSVPKLSNAKAPSDKELRDLSIKLKTSTPPSLKKADGGARKNSSEGIKNRSSSHASIRKLFQDVNKNKGNIDYSVLSSIRNDMNNTNNNKNSNSKKNLSSTLTLCSDNNKTKSNDSLFNSSKSLLINKENIVNLQYFDDSE